MSTDYEQSLARLRAAIEACSGPWPNALGWGGLIVGATNEDADYIAAANPRIISQLIAERDALKADAERKEPIGYIDRKDIARLSNYKATIWPGSNEIDAVPVYLAQHRSTPAEQPAHEQISRGMEP